jgi:pimeloyl-ACP methyl ester carboxylesterase
VEIVERRERVAGVETFWREARAPGAEAGGAAPVAGAAAPVLYLHGVPTNSDDWLPFLERTGGVAPDLPGFGRSGKPADFDYSPEGYAAWLEAFRAQLGLDRYRLLVHDWGGVGLLLAQAGPERVERLVVVDSVPFLPGYRWHRIARIWRTPLLGELFMGASTRFAFKLISREATAAPGPAPDDFIDRIWEHFDHGTQRAILKLYRAAPASRLPALGHRLGELSCPALVVWGAEDPYLDTSFAHAYGKALGGEARVEVVEGASHWPWLDRPELVERTAEYLVAR